jgi:uncharacterized protein (DUF1501 family)
MTKRTPSAATRREFLRRSSALAVAGGAAPFALNLAGIAEAAAQSSPGYKAVVCVFLFGGCDHLNTLIPYDTATHSLYAQLRSGLAIAQSELTNTVLTPANALTGGQQYALGPGLAPLLPLWNAGEMAALLNIGSLAAPTTKAQYGQASHPKPPKLFSHNDQQSVWQTLGSSEGATSGWGGNMGELLASGNGKANFTAISVSGNAVFLSGKNLIPYLVAPSGSVQIEGLRANPFGSAVVGNAMRDLIINSQTNSWLAQAHMDVVKRSISADIDLRSALAASTPPDTTGFPATGLGAQLAMVSKIIAARSNLGATKQVFFVGMGGFDHHADLLELHQPMMGQVATALAAFHAEMNRMSLGRQVTSFTASDFGRTNGNGSGSDHGWGGFHFVQGGAVNGRNFIGKPPLPGDNGPDDVESGRMLPTLAVDQLAAELARWMGVSETDLSKVVPGASRFDRIPLFV